MQTEITKEKIDALAEKIAKAYKPEKIILFGSRAWGNPGPDSDVDLFIVKETKDDRHTRSMEVGDLLWKVGFPVDILVYTPQEVARRLHLRDFFIEDVMQKGRVLYQTH